MSSIVTDRRPPYGAQSKHFTNDGNSDQSPNDRARLIATGNRVRGGYQHHDYAAEKREA